MKLIRRLPPPGLVRLSVVVTTFCLVAIGLVLPGHSIAQTDTLLLPHETVYKGTASAAPVRVRMRLRTTGDHRWVYESKVGTRGWLAWKKGKIRETSEFSLKGDQLASMVYRKEDTFSAKDRDIETRFSGDQLVSIYRDEEIKHTVTGAVFDLLNLRVKLMTDLAHDRLQPSYHVVDGKGRLKTLEVRRIGEENIATKQGAYDTVQLEYDDDDKKFLIWIAPALSYQLIRIDQYKDGKLKASLLLDSYRESPE